MKFFPFADMLVRQCQLRLAGLRQLLLLIVGSEGEGRAHKGEPVMCTHATYHCDSCGAVASVVNLVAPGQPDPRLTPEPTGLPPGISMILSDYGSISIAGGPLSVTLGPVPMRAVASALATGHESALYAIDSEYAPFWCPTCDASYCREHFRSWPVFDKGFFDYTLGVCPKGHERILLD